MYDDAGGIASVYEEIVEEGHKNICAFLSLDAVPAAFSEYSFDNFVKLYQKPGMKVREIISTKHEDHPYLKKVFAIPQYQGKLVAVPFFTDSIIYGDKIALFSFVNKFALVIESKTIAASLRSLFELAWQGAE